MTEIFKRTGCKSCVQLKVQPLGVVELSSFLILSSTINPIIEIAVIHPVLEKKSTQKLYLKPGENEVNICVFLKRKAE